MKPGLKKAEERQVPVASSLRPSPADSPALMEKKEMELLRAKILKAMEDPQNVIKSAILIEQLLKRP